MNFTDFQLIVLGDANNFQQSIRDYGEDGWMLYGSPFVNLQGFYCQAMIRQ